MSNQNTLNWDNMEEVIASLPKDENGRFLPNANRFKKSELTLSVDRDKWHDQKEETPRGMGNHWSEDISEDAEVIHLHFGDGREIRKAFPAETTNILLEAANNRTGIEEELFPTIVPDSTKPLFHIDKEQAELENDPLLRAQRSLANLDTSEAEKELEAQAKANNLKKALRDSGLDKIKDSPLNNPDMTPEQLNEWRIKQASKIVSKMDYAIENGGRVNVADKFLMNCEADLNQLIPFKYNWSWSLYLTSCGNHWMPAEMELDRCTDQYANLPSNIKKIVARAYMSFLSRKRLFPESVLMNIYRMLSNPECRQYLLRQGMESVTVSHAWMEINESLKVKNTLIDGGTIALVLRKDDETFRERHSATMNAVQFMHNYESKTSKKEDLAEFVKAFIILYTHTNWISPMISHYQVITGLEFNESCQSLAQMFMRLNRDGISQFEFAKLFIAGVVSENPEINTPEWYKDIERTLKHLINVDLDLVQSLSVGVNEYYDVNYIANHYKDEVLSLLNPSLERHKPTGDYSRGAEFVTIISNIAPVVDHSAGLGTIEW